MNKVILIGRLTADPKIEYTENATTARAKFCLAVSRGKDKQGNEQTDFPLITAWHKTAELVDKYVHKGDRVCIEGRVITGKYIKDDRTYYTTDIYADRVEFLSEKKAEAPQEQSAIPQEQTAIPFATLDDDIPF